jgi:hypothetical protein
LILSPSYNNFSNTLKSPDFIEAFVSIIMSDYRQRSPVDPAFLSDNNNYDPISIDDDSDTDTIRMDSPEFWSGINAEKAPVQNAPHSVMLTKSTPVSTFLKYPSCGKLDCTCPVRYPASTQDQLAEENSETNEIESSA